MWIIELYEPTIAPAVPRKMKRWNGFSAMNPSQSEGKFAYLKLNSQMPCPPRGTVPVNTRQDIGKFFISVPAGSLSVMAATAPAM
jgi:hypothetical protein